MAKSSIDHAQRFGMVAYSHILSSHSKAEQVCRAQAIDLTNSRNETSAVIKKLEHVVRIGDRNLGQVQSCQKHLASSETAVLQMKALYKAKVNEMNNQCSAQSVVLVSPTLIEGTTSVTPAQLFDSQKTYQEQLEKATIEYPAQLVPDMIDLVDPPQQSVEISLYLHQIDQELLQESLLKGQLPQDTMPLPSSVPSSEEMNVQTPVEKTKNPLIKTIKNFVSRNKNTEDKDTKKK